MAGTIVIANANELKIATMTLMAIEPTNSPAGPGIKAIGANANAVVSVEPSNGKNKWLTDLATAAVAFNPIRSFDETSSTTTIALSINSPSAMIRPVIDI